MVQKCQHKNSMFYDPNRKRRKTNRMETIFNQESNKTEENQNENGFLYDLMENWWLAENLHTHKAALKLSLRYHILANCIEYIF